MRALVTGSRGFVGPWLTAHLCEEGDDVVGVDHEVEMTDGEQVRRAVLDAAPDAIYHLAARTHVGESWSAPAEAFAVNTLGTLHVLQAARQCARRPRVLVVSSAEVYGAVDERDLPVAETTPLAPVSPYAASKVAAEFLGLQAHLAGELEVVRVRPFNHIGPGQSPRFFVAALAQRIVHARGNDESRVAVGNLAARRDLTDVRDVVRAYRLVVVRAPSGEVYNVCSGTARSMEDVAHRLLELVGVELELVPDPALMRPVDVPVLCGDPTKMHDATGWSPQIDLDQTLRDVLEHCQATAA